MKVFIHARHQKEHDVNDNPRRLFLVYEIEGRNGSNLIDVIDEGYRGRSVLYESHPDAVQVGTVMILSPKEYKETHKTQ